MRSFYTLIIVFFLTQTLLAQSVVFKVRQTATGLNNGSSWDNAYVQLNDALKAAKAGDTIWVAQGIYTPTTDNNRDSSFVLKDSVCVLGGFAGTETMPFERSYHQYPTILSGDIGVVGDSLDNSFNVIKVFNASERSVLDGFIIEKGFANSTAPVNLKPNGRRGAGIFLRPAALGKKANPTVQNCTFRENSCTDSGSALYYHAIVGDSTHILLDRCVFERNGAGIVINAQLRNTDITIKNSHFRDNKNSYLSAITYNGGESTIVMEEDTFMHTGSAAFNILALDGPTALRFNKSVFDGIEGNTLVRLGTAFYEQKLYVDNCKITSNKGVLFENIFGHSRFENNIITNNDTIGVFFQQKTKNFIRNNYFANNKVGISSGGQILFNNNVFTNNTTRFDFFIFNTPDAFHEWARVENCLFYQNKGMILDSVYYSLFKPASTYFAHCSFINCSPLYDTTYLFYSKSRDTLNLEGCLFYNTPGSPQPLLFTGDVATHRSVFSSPNCGSYVAGPAPKLCNASNIFGANLSFRDTSSLDYTLEPCSDGVNLGAVGTFLASDVDVSGAPRVQNNAPDAGAFETFFEIRRDTIVPLACPGQNNASVQYTGPECLSYAWENVSNGQNGAELTNLGPGVYYIEVTASGYTYFDTVAIVNPPVPWVVTETLVPAGSATAANGAIILEIDGNTGPYSFGWNTGDTTSYLYLVPAGSYQVTITDGNGCTAAYSYVLGVSGTRDTEPDRKSVV